MGTKRHLLALLVAALTLIGGIALSTAPAPVSADGGDAEAGSPRAIADRITAGDKHTCAIGSEPGDVTGTVHCWGNNFVGQLGLGDTANRGDGPGEMANQLPDTDLGQRARSISAGTAHTCAVLANSSVKCWGYNSSGQLGLGDVESRGDTPGEMGSALPAVALGTGRTAVMVTAGVEHVCALLDNGKVKCWGDNSLGQLGLGDTNDRGDGPGEMGDALPYVDLGTGRTAITVSAAASHTCAVLDTHAVKCWGSAEVGQLGLGDTNHRGDAPGEMGDALGTVDLGEGITPRAITTGRFHTCVQVTNTAVKCWGLNTNGQLGVGDTLTRGDEPGEMGAALPLVETGTTITGLAAMGSANCVVGGQGHDSQCWGANAKGQLARGDVLESFTPSFSSIGYSNAVAGGLEHLCVVRPDSTIRCIGANDSGQLGYGTTSNLGDEAGETTNLQNVDLSQTATPIAIGTGDYHSCFVLPGGLLRCTGDNTAGQLGYGDTTARGLTPETVGNSLPVVNLGTGRTVVSVAASDSNTCAILDNGSLKCWGRNTNGILGLGDTASRGDAAGEMGDALPTIALGTGRTALEVSMSASHTCARLDDGTVKCWGDNFGGQLGQGDTLDRGDGPNEMGDLLPAIALGTGRTAVRVAAGAGFTCVLLDNGKVKCWGEGSGGRIADGAGAAIGNAPGEMGDDLPYVDLGTGRTALDLEVSTTACVVLDTHQVKCWGPNENGEAGHGDTSAIGDAPGEMGDALAVVPLGTGRTALDVSVGNTHTCAVLDNGTMKCWGLNSTGQLGLDDMVSRGDGPNEMGDNLPVVKLAGAAPMMIAAGAAHTCAVLSTGWTKCWGWNAKGQLALGSSNFGSVGLGVGSMANAGFSAVGGPFNRVIPFVVSPGIPFDVSAVAGNASAELSWTAPRTDGGSAVTGYRVERSTDGGQTWTVAVANTASTETSASLTGLTNGSAIRFRVAAINTHGASAASVASAPVVPATVPGAATGMTGIGKDGAVVVSWTAAPSNGSAIVGHRIDTSTDNGATWKAAILDTGSAATSATISGLTNFVPVRFRVTASNALGVGPVSASSAAITPVTTKYWPLRPVRLADTRTGATTVDGTFRATGALKAGGVMSLKVVGRGGVPTGAKAATLNVTIVKPTAAGSVSVFPCGSSRSTATTLTFAAGATVANTVVAKVGSSGNVCIHSSAATHLAVDVSGVHPAGDTYVPLNPARLAGTVAVKAGGVLTVKVAGRGGVPTTAKAATLNVTIVKPTAAGRVTVYPCGSTRSTLATIIFAAGTTTANMAVTRLGTGAAICVHSSVAAGVQVDVIGAHTAASFHAVTPTRLASKAVAARGVLVVGVAGKAGVPVGTRAAVVNITVTKTAAAGALIVYPCTATRPVATATAYKAASTTTQTVVAALATNGTMCIYTSAAATILVDVTGNH
jgi:alpha-tubulin suppressor-like RCC1 family protein